jgi:hypothetical protein
MAAEATDAPAGETRDMRDIHLQERADTGGTREKLIACAAARAQRNRHRIVQLPAQCRQ